jgi:tetratricopeptide (TPR) repeat protein
MLGLTQSANNASKTTMTPNPALNPDAARIFDASIRNRPARHIAALARALLIAVACTPWTHATPANVPEQGAQGSGGLKATGQASEWALTPLLERAYSKLKSIPSVKVGHQRNSVVKLPESVAVRHMLRAGDISELKRYLPDLHRRYAVGEVSETDFYRALAPLYAILPEALPALDQWVNQSPREYAAYLSRGIVRARLGWEARGDDPARYVPKKDFEEMRRWHALAAQDYLASLDLSARPVPSIAGLIALAPARSKFDEARRLYDEGMRISPGSSAIFIAFEPLLDWDWGGRSFAEAEMFLLMAQRSGVEPEAWSSLKRGIDNANSGNRYTRDPKAAREYLIQFSEKYQTMDGWLTRAVEERKLGLYEDAERSFERAAEIRPNSRKLLEERATFYEQRGMLAAAVTSYRRASDLESNYAQEKLIFAHARGALGLKVDFSAARRTCEESAAAHNPAGEYCLGWLYREGLAGLPRDPKEAAKWERLSAHHGNAAAANDIGWRLLRGDGIPANREEAIYFLRKAARGGHQGAVTKLQQLDEPIEEPNTKEPSIDDTPSPNRA